MLEDKLQVGLFHYGPALWRLGNIELLHELRNARTRSEGIKKILAAFPEYILREETKFFRIRKNLDETQELDSCQYDAPPTTRKEYGRLDSGSLPVMYGSESLEICVHECRVLIPDECFVATLTPTRNLRLLDLTSFPNQEPHNEFESILLSMRFLFAAKIMYMKSRERLHVLPRGVGLMGYIIPLISASLSLRPFRI